MPSGLARDIGGGLLAIGLVSLGLLGLNLGFAKDPPLASGQGPVVVAPSADSDPAPDPAPAPTASGAVTPAEPAPVEEPIAAARPPLTVLNHSRISGLAARAAEDFRQGGWEIVEVGNTRRPVAVTTVFFAPGQEAAAADLRAAFSAIRQSAPRPADLPGQGLTVVVTREYPR